MNTVAERPAKVKVIRERPSAERPSKTSKPTPAWDAPTKAYPASAIKSAFGQVEVLLGAAHMTQENHDWSGDSCRLLRIAHGLAAQASQHPPEGNDIEQAAFDIAALIRAARTVPGDSESPERRVLVDQAAVQLNWLTECDAAGQDCCDPGVPRPAAPTASGAIAAAPQEEADFQELARQSNFEILKLAEALQTLALHEGSEEHPIVYGIAARICMLSEVVFHAARLHGATRESFGGIEFDALKRRVQGRLS